ncbi:MAG: hypothetical protein QOJ85_3582, partial [Solirubrobacteraceae bacterium]|nr:hypothetical protein [Solirubrobacteraceae bacterium]
MSRCTLPPALAVLLALVLAAPATAAFSIGGLS